MIRTSETHPIRVDAVPVRNGLLGLTFCPGKHGDSLTGPPWARDLDLDLSALQDWETELVLTLMEQHEFALLSVPDLGPRVMARGMDWRHLPIPDQGTPTVLFEKVWPDIRADLLARLEAGGRAVLHCRGGLGRTGLVAALVLIDIGMEANDAIRAVRSVRPRAIETAAQEQYVRFYRTRKNTPSNITIIGKHGEFIVQSLEQIKRDHMRYGHHGQALEIVEELRRRYPALEIFGPEDAESGRYVAVYVTLVPSHVRLRITLSSSKLNQHGYNLQPITESMEDRRRFIEFMAHHYPSIHLKKDGYYAKLPGWIRVNVKNDNHDAIARHVQRALKFFTSTPYTEDGQ